MERFLINIFCTTVAWLVVYPTLVFVLLAVVSLTVWDNLFLLHIKDWHYFARGGVTLGGLGIYIHMWRK
ncbi:MAG: hypothetical protein GY928_31185 [Colwellia sp.]|nr:hypothetical protein [Colwellia sp.]